MHIFFSGIGGVGIGPLAQIAHDAGYDVSGSDTHESMMSTQLSSRGITVSDDQSGDSLRQRHEASPIDWLVYTAALPSDHPELIAARELGIKTTKRDEFLTFILKEKNLKLIAVSGTHGKTTTTGMIVWLAKYFGIPVSYLVGTTLSWGPSGHYAPGSEYFVYECDEFDRNFLQFHPEVSLVTSLEYDHPDTYASEADYMAAFKQFTSQSQNVFTWRKYEAVFGDDAHYIDTPNEMLTLAGEHNRRNASLVIAALEHFNVKPSYVADGLNHFPGTSRRFEKLGTNLYSDYGHTPTEIAATLQMAHELSDKVVLVYQPHQNIRQHEIKDQYTDEIFKDAEKIYWLPTYLSREDGRSILTPEELSKHLTNVELSELDDALWDTIVKAKYDDTLVLCMGAGSIDGWVRKHVSGK